VRAVITPPPPPPPLVQVGMALGAATLAACGAVLRAACKSERCVLVSAHVGDWCALAATLIAVSIPARLCDRVIFSAIALIGEVVSLAFFQPVFFYASALEGSVSRFMWIGITWSTYDGVLSTNQPALIENGFQCLFAFQVLAVLRNLALRISLRHFLVGTYEAAINDLLFQHLVLLSASCRHDATPDGHVKLNNDEAYRELRRVFLSADFRRKLDFIAKMRFRLYNRANQLVPIARQEAVAPFARLAFKRLARIPAAALLVVESKALENYLEGFDPGSVSGTGSASTVATAGAGRTPGVDAGFVGSTLPPEYSASALNLTDYTAAGVGPGGGVASARGSGGSGNGGGSVGGGSGRGDTPDGGILGGDDVGLSIDTPSVPVPSGALHAPPGAAGGGRPRSGTILDTVTDAFASAFSTPTHVNRDLRIRRQVSGDIRSSTSGSSDIATARSIRGGGGSGGLVRHTSSRTLASFPSPSVLLPPVMEGQPALGDPAARPRHASSASVPQLPPAAASWSPTVAPVTAPPPASLPRQPTSGSGRSTTDALRSRALTSMTFQPPASAGGTAGAPGSASPAGGVTAAAAADPFAYQGAVHNGGSGDGAGVALTSPAAHHAPSAAAPGGHVRLTSGDEAASSPPSASPPLPQPELAVPPQRRPSPIPTGARRVSFVSSKRPSESPPTVGEGSSSGATERPRRTSGPAGLSAEHSVGALSQVGKFLSEALRAGLALADDGEGDGRGAASGGGSHNSTSSTSFAGANGAGGVDSSGPAAGGGASDPQPAAPAAPAASKPVYPPLTLSHIATVVDTAIVDVDKALSLFDSNGDGQVEMAEFIAGAEAAWTNLHSLRASLSGHASATAINWLLDIAFWIIIAAVSLSIFSVPVVDVFVPLGTVCVSASFAIGASLSNVVSSLIFVLVVRPYAVRHAACNSAAALAFIPLRLCAGWRPSHRVHRVQRGGHPDGAARGCVDDHLCAVRQQGRHGAQSPVVQQQHRELQAQPSSGGPLGAGRQLRHHGSSIGGPPPPIGRVPAHAAPILEAGQSHPHERRAGAVAGADHLAAVAPVVAGHRQGQSGYLCRLHAPAVRHERVGHRLPRRRCQRQSGRQLRDPRSGSCAAHSVPWCEPWQRSRRCSCIVTCIAKCASCLFVCMAG